MLSRTQAGQLSKSRKKFLATTYKPLFTSLYKHVKKEKIVCLRDLSLVAIDIGRLITEGADHRYSLFCRRRLGMALAHYMSEYNVGSHTRT